MREAIKGNDIDAMKTTYDDLQNKFQEVSDELYKQAAASAGRTRRCRGPAAVPAAKAEPQSEVRARKQTATSSMRSSRSWTKTRRSNRF